MATIVTAGTMLQLTFSKFCGRFFAAGAATIASASVCSKYSGNHGYCNHGYCWYSVNVIRYGLSQDF